MSEIPEPSDLATMRWWPYLCQAYEIPIITLPEGALEQLKDRIIECSGVTVPFNDADAAAQLAVGVVLELGQDGRLDQLVNDPDADAGPICRDGTATLEAGDLQRDVGKYVIAVIQKVCDFVRNDAQGLG
jgi:hypothetical protein